MGGIKLSSMQADVQRMIELGASGDEDAYAGMGEQFWLAKTGTAFYERLRAKVDGERIFFSLADVWSSCTASQGDVINVQPGYTETITGAGGITCATAGVKVKGWGRYDLRPVFLIDGAAASVLITAAQVELNNLVFNSGHADLAYCIHTSAKGIKIANCFFGENTAAENFKIAVSVGTADNDSDGIELIGNNYVGIDAADTGCFVINKDCNDVRILGNFICGDFGTTPFAPIYMPDNEIPFNMEIAYNIIHNLHDQDATVGISVLEAVATGSIHHNYIYALDVAGSTPILSGATGMACFENYYTFEGNNSGYLYPVVGTAA